MAWIETASGIALPTPIEGSSAVTISTFVDGGRNQQGNFIGQPVGDDKYKIECNFDFETPEQVRDFLRLFDRKQGGSFVHDFRVFDMALNDFVIKKMYVSDRTGRPMNVSPTTMRPAFWRDIKISLVEV